MAEPMQQKRKRAVKDEGDSAKPRKSRVIDTETGSAENLQQAKHQREAPLPERWTEPPKKGGLSRQEKSERRSKKSKKEKTAKKQATFRSSRPVDDLAHGDDYVSLEKPGSAEKLIKKSSKKPKATASSLADDVPPSSIDTAATIDDAMTPKKSSKSKKANTSEASEGLEAPPNTVDSLSSTNKTKKDRFIVFVGNLPYTVTPTQIKTHFAKIADGIKRVSQSTDKATGRGKGFAFLEFDRYDKMQSCLKLYHHSIFDPDRNADGANGASPDHEGGDQHANKKRDPIYSKPKGRRINVELTAGGGGGSTSRKEKIKTKNSKLDEERERIRVKQKEVKDKEERKAARSRGTDANKTALGERNADVKKEEPIVEDQRGEIHPSRLSRVRA